MSETNLLIVEQRGSTGEILTYERKGRNDIAVSTGGFIAKSYHNAANIFREILLPYGYPESVSEDYLRYQIWDTAQAFCSTVTGAFTTRAVLKSVGVGDARANAASAAVTWILKDGTGMIGRIVFAWWKGNGLDWDCKKWRFFADILNDSAMTVELVLPFFSNYSMPLLCATSTMKSIVGVAGGATRASITHHQAIRDNMAEISAKDGTQETLVNLLGSVVSIYLLNVFNGTVTEWAFIFTLMALHLMTNYLAVKALVFKNFNDQRMALVLKTFFSVGAVLSPQKINEKENVFLGCGLKVSDFCGFKISMGQPLDEAIKSWNAADLKQTLSLYKDKEYFLLVDVYKKHISVSFERDESPESVLRAYFHAVCLAIATSIYNGIELDIYSKRQLHHTTPITKLYTFMKSFEKTVNRQNMPYNHLLDLEEFVKQEYSAFQTALQVNGWNLNSHSLKIGEWRSKWKQLVKKDI